MPANRDIFLIGYASGLAARVPGSAAGPVCLQRSEGMAILSDHHLTAHWQPLIQESGPLAVSKTTRVAALCGNLLSRVQQMMEERHFFVVLGGDHSCAIGTWSGAAAALRQAGRGDLGLIWIDAHMDSHTPQTTLTGNIHGMPLATLLGQGDAALTRLAGFSPVLKPEHVCLIGVRSFESEEAELLKKLGVHVFYMHDVKERGLPAILRDARARVAAGTGGYGISLDVDSIDPEDAPGTGVPEPDGIRAKVLSGSLRALAGDPLLIGCEVVEFDPTLDVANKTEKLVPELIVAMAAV